MSDGALPYCTSSLQRSQASLPIEIGPSSSWWPAIRRNAGPFPQQQSSTIRVGEDSNNDARGLSVGCTFYHNLVATLLEDWSYNSQGHVSRLQTKINKSSGQSSGRRTKANFGQKGRVGQVDMAVRHAINFAAFLPLPTKKSVIMFEAGFPVRGLENGTVWQIAVYTSCAVKF